MTQSYTPYGEVLESQGIATTDYAFTGESYDPLTGLVYLRARYFSSDDGRFISKDTWLGNNNEPSSYNKWLYGNGNPINLTDPSGMCISMDGTGKCIGNIDVIRALKRQIEADFGLLLTSTKDGMTIDNGIENWDENALNLLRDTVSLVAIKFRNNVDWDKVVKLTGFAGRISGNILFKAFYSGLEIRRGSPDISCVQGFSTCYYGLTRAGYLYKAYGPQSNWQPGSTIGRNTILHELGHIIDQRSQTTLNGYVVTNAYTRALLKEMSCNQSLRDAINKIWAHEAVENRYATQDLWQIRSGFGVNLRTASNAYEIWADMFASWVINEFPHETNGINGEIYKNFIGPFMRNELTNMAILHVPIY